MVRLTDELTPKRAKEIDKTYYIPEFEGECEPGESATMAPEDFSEKFWEALKRDAPLIKRVMKDLDGRRD